MAELIEPEKSELYFRKKMLGNPHTMDWLGKTIPFPEEEWQEFYDSYVHADPSQRFYRLIYCRSCNDFVGSVSYELNHETGRYEMKLLIDSGRRFCGYGRYALNAIKKAAKEAGIPSLWVRIDKSNTAYDFLERNGFSRACEDETSYIEFCEL